MLTYFLVGGLVLVSLCLAVSVFYNYKFGIIILNMQEGVETCLDILDEKYRSISKIAELPIFFDSAEVRQVVKDISVCRDAVLIVANELAGSVSEEEEWDELQE